MIFYVWTLTLQLYKSALKTFSNINTQEQLAAKVQTPSQPLNSTDADTQCSKSYSPSPFIGQYKYWWGRCLPCQTNDAVQHRPVHWRAPLGQDQSEPGSWGESEPVIVLLETTTVRHRAKQRKTLVKCSNKTYFWYQVMNPQLPHRCYFRKLLNLQSVTLYSHFCLASFSIMCGLCGLPHKHLCGDDWAHFCDNTLTQSG